MRDNKRDFCSVANQGCKAPCAIGIGGGIGVMDKTTRGVCYQCGLAVCTNCSKRRNRRVMCQRCLEENER